MTELANPLDTVSPARWYEEFFGPTTFGPMAEALLERAQPRSGERVLDVACGTGAVTRRVAPLVGPTGVVVGLDIAPPMLEVAQSLPVPSGAAITWTHGSAEELPYPDASFDLVLCQQGLQFFPDQPAALRETRRVLAPAGRFATLVWAALDQQPPIDTVMTEALERHMGAPPFLTPFNLGDPDDLQSLLINAGFTSITMETVSLVFRFPSARGYVRDLVIAAGAVDAEFMNLDPAFRDELIEAVQRDVEPTFREYLDGEELVAPMVVNIATATT